MHGRIDTHVVTTIRPDRIRERNRTIDASFGDRPEPAREPSIDGSSWTAFTVGDGDEIGMNWRDRQGDDGWSGRTSSIRVP
jgi:hypothetical protein